MAAERWLIVGGGMLGLVLALRLAGRGERVAVFEAAPGFGGLAAPWEIETRAGQRIGWDRYYHVIAGGDAALRGLLEELGLGPRLVWRRTHTRFYDGSRLQPLDHALDYLRLSGLSALDKARLGWTVLRAAAASPAALRGALDTMSAEQWLRQAGGEPNWRRLWRPLLRSKLGANAEHASAAYIVAVIQRFYGARQGASRSERFGHVDGGYATVTAALLGRLRALGAELHAGWPVQAITREGQGGFTLHGPGQARERGERVVLTCATPLAARLTAALLPEAENRALEMQRWQGIVCVSLLATRALTGAYLTYLTDESLPFTTVIEMSDLVDRGAFGGHHLAYLPRYVPAEDALLDAPDEAIVESFVAGLLRLVPDLRREEIVGLRVARTRHVLALATPGAGARLPPMHFSVPGLHLVSSAQIVDAALSVDQTVQLAERGAAELLGSAR